jgi:hypothetical protein
MNLDTVLNNQLESPYREYFGRHLPIALEYARPVLQSDCHTLKYYMVPDYTQGNLVTGDYTQTTISLEPGSFLLGFIERMSTGQAFLVQITDTATGHKLFSDPVPNTMLFRDNGMWLLPCPMPVIAPGLLLVEIYATTTGQCQVRMVVAELDREAAIAAGCLRRG